jgi:aspartate/methionine/tyrosine aminotransferase
VPFKATNQMTERLDALRAKGLDPINLSTARPNFDTPQRIKNAAKAALDVSVTYILYSDSRGLLELREAIARKLAAENSLHVDPGDQVIVTAGTHEALSAVLLATVSPGDEVLLIDPSWVAYKGMVGLAGATPMYVALTSGRLDANALRAAVTPATKAIVFNNPNNPTGTVFTRKELDEIARVAIEADLLVIVDEIYEYFLYDGNEHISIGSLPGMAERTVTINGLSKAYAMTGWRIGYAAGPAGVMASVLAIHQHLISSPTNFAQKGAVTAFEAAHHDYRPMVEAYTARRNALAAGLANVPWVEASLPEGACFFFIRVAGGVSSAELSELFLEKGGLMLPPGAAFGPSGEGHLRLSFAGLPEERVAEVLERMAEVGKHLRALTPTIHQGGGKEWR